MKAIPTFQENILLSKFSTFGIGGPARYFVEVHQIEEMQSVLKKCLAENLRYIVIGKGSNCLFDDRGFAGVVIYNRIDFITTLSPGVFHAGAGFSFSLLGAQTARQGWTGLEFASGIPGSVGGAVFMNAGANGGDVSQTLVSVDFVTNEGELQTIGKEDLKFGYRYSIFHALPGAIVGAIFRLAPSSHARKDQLEIINYRKKTQPYGAKSAGCVFRNPTQMNAGALIDHHGLKGMQIGKAKVSDVHANFIINEGGATSSDVLQLIAAIQSHLKEKSGIDLQSEIRIISGYKEEP